MVGGGARREWVDGREPRVNQGDLLGPDVGGEREKVRRDNNMIEQRKAIQSREERIERERGREKRKEGGRERERERGDETRQSGRMRSFGCADINATGQVTVITHK